MEKLISIIVPCYNVEKYLNNALTSVLKQKYKVWECIIIDDGSTDNTAIIAKQWQKKDSRFIYIYQENKGLSGARNSGIKIAKGKFIYFYDPDDLLNNNTLQNLYNLVTDEIDIVIGKCASVNGQTTDEINYLPHNPKPLITHNNVNKNLLKLVIQQRLICVAWNKLIRKTLIDKNNLQFKDRLLHEDELWFFETLFHANNIILNDTVTYYYNIANNNSITKTFNEKNITSYLSIIKEIYTKYYNNTAYIKYKEFIAIFITDLKIKTIEHCYKQLSKQIKLNFNDLISKMFISCKTLRATKILSSDIEELHYKFRLIQCLPANKQLNFLRYYKSPKGFRPLKIKFLLNKALKTSRLDNTYINPIKQEL